MTANFELNDSDFEKIADIVIKKLDQRFNDGPYIKAMYKAIEERAARSVEIFANKHLWEDSLVEALEKKTFWTVDKKAEEVLKSKAYTDLFSKELSRYFTTKEANYEELRALERICSDLRKKLNIDEDY